MIVNLQRPCIMKYKNVVSIVSFLLIPVVFAIALNLWWNLQNIKQAGTPLDKHPQRGWQLPSSGTDQHGHTIQRDSNGMRPTKRTGKKFLIYTNQKLYFI